VGSRGRIASALDAGLLRDAHEGARMFIWMIRSLRNRFVIDDTGNARYYLYFHTGKRFRVFPLDRLTSGGNECFECALAFRTM
jgi:hypothetical protein